MGNRAALACAGLLLAAACDRPGTVQVVHEVPPDDVGALPVGAVLDLSGPAARETASALRELRAALERVNAKGGIRGRRVDLYVLDDRGRPGESGIGARRLHEEFEAVVLVSQAGDERRQALGPVGLPVVVLEDGEMLLEALTAAGDYRPATIEKVLDSLRAAPGR